MSQRVHVIGAGLLGGSIALSLANAGWIVSIEDETAEKTGRALQLLSLSNAPLKKEDIDVVIVAVPISANKSTNEAALEDYPNATVIEIASVKTNSLPDVNLSNTILDRFVSTHPFAGKEVRGAEHASVDLFQDRIWAICDGAYLSNTSKNFARQVIQDCGAIPVHIDLDQHDEIVGLTSHLPQILATLLSEQMSSVSDSALLLSGNGLKDMTRLASSSGELWSEIVLNNADNLTPILEEMLNSIKSFQSAVAQHDFDSVLAHFHAGGKQKDRFPGKHGDAIRDYAKIEVQILDQPGELAKIFTQAHETNINIEDVRINHTLGRNIAILEIFVAPEIANDFAQILKDAGWHVRGNLISGGL